jgi:hypothetical protein
MTYVPPRRRGGRNRVVVALSILGVVLASVLLLVVVNFISQRPDRVKLGRDTFQVGDAQRLAKRISEQHEPFLFKDPVTSGPGRELYVQHLGSDARHGWIAIEAYAPGAPHELRCILQWDRQAQVFRNPCGGETYPASGTGLRVYPATVLPNGQVEVNLRTPVGTSP